MIYLIVFLIVLIVILITAFIFNFKKPIEKFTNNKNNLLTNGSFHNGQHLKENQGLSGKHDIIVHPNSGQTSYVLRQSYNRKMDKNAEIYYRVETTLKPNTNFILGCLYYSSEKNPLHHRISFNGSSNHFNTQKDSKKTPKGKFNYMYTLFKTPASDEPILVTIDIAFNFNNISGFNYITDIGLFELVDNNGIPIIDDLRTYINAYNPDVFSGKKLNDLSGLNNNFTSFIEQKKGQITLSGNTITGNSAFKLQNSNQLALNDQFSLVMLVKGITQQVETFVGEEEEEERIPVPTLEGDCLLSISGNQGVALAIYLPKSYGKIQLIAGGELYQSNIEYLVSMDTMIGVTYNGNNVQLYLNEQRIIDTICPKIYFDNKPLMINPYRQFIGQLYAFAYYNHFLHMEDIVALSKYFLKMKSVGKELATVNSKMLENIEAFIITTPIAKTEDKKDGNCPEVRYEDGHYYVIVPKNSALEQKVGYSGLRDYGTNIETAKLIFETNFPQCPVPNILDKRKYKANLNKCPFLILGNENPCSQFDCQKADWEKGYVKDKKCKNAIEHYCRTHNDKDPACYCWKDENKNKPECLKFRGKFETEDRCDFRKYNIEKHPDFKDYINIDKIPCWSCNLKKPN